MNEAVEIAKLRLFLKLVSTAEVDYNKDNYGLEPLPDIDFNIRCGNTLVGFATEDELKDVIVYDENDNVKMFWEDEMNVFEEECEVVAKAYKRFQNSQLITDEGDNSLHNSKLELQQRLKILNDKMDKYLASVYGIDADRKSKDYNKWLISHQPFHWFSEFYEIIHNGGFDVIIGNPPYVQASKIDYKLHFSIAQFSNIFAYIQIRCINLIHEKSISGLIVPMSFTSIRDFSKLRKIIHNSFEVIYTTNHSIRPSALFTGISQRVSIVLLHGKNKPNKYLYTTYYLRSKKSKNLFENISYADSYLEKKRDSLIPKIGNKMGTILWKKINTYKASFNSILIKKEKSLFFKDYGETYWIFPFNFSPYFTPLKSFKELKIDSNYVNDAFCSLNSTVHYFFYSAISDCWHFGNWHLNQFPIVYQNITFDFSNLAVNLEHSLKKNRITRFDKRANGNIFEYKINKSKFIIDEIDTVLAQYYGFTEVELDFIINYDIKYRMGKELENYINGEL